MGRKSLVEGFVSPPVGPASYSGRRSKGFEDFPAEQWLGLLEFPTAMGLGLIPGQGEL